MRNIGMVIASVGIIKSTFLSQFYSKRLQGEKLKRIISARLGQVAVVWLIAFFSFSAHAALSPEVSRGITWLQSQVQTDGSVLNENLSVATPVQSRAEVLVTLKQLATPPPALIDLLAADPENNTEYLARRALVLAMAGRDSSILLSTLTVRQNTDGGFSGELGHESNISDTARVLLAFAYAGQGGSSTAFAARDYLIGNVQIDGGMPGESDVHRLNQSALGLAALLSVSADIATMAATQKISTWLKQQQNVDGSWNNDQYLTSQILVAIYPTVADATVKNNARNFLLTAQGGDGSWGGDAFITALALRALTFESTPPMVVGATLTGQVANLATGVALAGASITLVGSNVAPIQTGIDGLFSFTGLAPGSYTLLVDKAGYNSFTNTYSMNAGQTLAAGIIGLTQSATTSIVRGKVIAGATSLPLAGVTIALSGITAATTSTDATGNFEITAVTPGAVTVTASLAGYNAVSGVGNVLAGQTLVFSPALFATTDPNVPTTGHFTGQIVAQGTGAALAGVTIQLNGVTAGTTAADGRFDLVIAPANYHAIISLAGYDSVAADFLLTAGATVSMGTISLVKQLTSTTIHGVVTDQITGTAIAGASVQVVSGMVTTTAADGSYTLANLAGLTFDLRVSATGYTSQNIQLQLSQPSDITHNFALQIQPSSGLDLAPLTVTPGSAASNINVDALTTMSNPGSISMSGVLTLDVLNAAGVVVGSGLAYDASGSNLLGVVALNPGASVPVTLRWNTGQFAPQTYTLIARISEAGSINQTNPRGRVLAERSATVAVIASPHFTGTVTPNPPVLRAKTNTPVHLSALLQNDGNVELVAQSYTLQIVNIQTGVVILTQSISGASFLSGELQNLAFADWIPVDGGNYRAELTAATAPEQGKISATIYVGDAVSGNFTVSKSVVPAGTQTVTANIHISGQDVTLGTISDPLAPLIKAAVQKAVTYNDATASNATLSHGCTACHVETQALVGGELTRHLTSYNTSQRNVLLNALTNNQQSGGELNGYGYNAYQRTQTMLGLWALNTWHLKTEIVSTLVKAANYLINNQEASGRWTADHESGWWVAPSANTGFNVKSLIDVSQLLQQVPPGSAANFTSQPWISGNGISGSYYLGSDTANNVYVSNYNVGTVTQVKPDGSMQTVMSGVAGARTTLFAPDGTLYVVSDSGLFKRNADGTKSTITTSRGTGLAWGPDGNFYMADYWANKILKVTPQGDVSDYIVGGALNGPHNLIFSSSGDLLVVNYTNDKILRYKADKSYETVMQWTSGKPLSIVPNGNSWLVGTSTGLYRYNSDWQGERLTYSTAYGLTVTPDGRIVTGDGGTSIYKVNQTAVDSIAELSSLDSAISKGVNWLLADTTFDANSNLQLAHRLIGFGAAKKYYLGTAKEVTIQAQMDVIATTLRARQRADGGWGQYSWYGSDSMVTAQVGVALDYMNPTAKDVIVQNALTYLLGRQQADGSWYSENGILSTHLAATTWVAIWLPIALDRIGGIDTDLSVTLPSNVTLANSSQVPTSVQITPSGDTNYVWKLQGVTSAGRDISFDATLSNLGVNETRPVATDAHLSFTNTFTLGKVDAPLTVPSVTGSAFMTLGVTTDQAQYGPNSPVAINALVSNLAAAVNGGSVKLAIYAADNVLAADSGTLVYPSLAAALSPQTPGQQTQSTQWNTGAYAPGSYYVLATLFDTQNRTVATATTHFNIVNGLSGSLAGAAISVDKIAYLAYDTVRVADRIRNLTQNQMLDNLSASTTLYAPDGTQRWSSSALLGQLIANDLRDLSYSVPLGNAPAGSYRAVLRVQDATGLTVATAETTFTVQSSAVTGSGLKGLVAVQPKQVPQGDIALLSQSVENLGNAALNSLPVTLSVVDPVTQQVVAQWPQTLNLGLGLGTQNIRSFSTDTLPVGRSYVVVLSATVGSTLLTLAQDTFTIIEPPVKLDVQQAFVRTSRVLVLVSCQDSAGNKAVCTAARLDFLDQYLSTLGIDHRLVTDDEAFRDSLRSGYYNTYWLSGGGEKLHDLIGEELREAIYRGDGLILDAVHDDRNKVLGETAGTLYRGKLSPLDLPISVGQPLFITNIPPIFAPIELTSQGRALQLQLAGGVQQANFSNAHKPSELPYPAIISHDYGLGKSLTFAFELVNSLQTPITPNIPAAPEGWKTLLQTSLGYVWPALPATAGGREYRVARTEIKNLARAAGLTVTTRLPTGTALLSTQPLAPLDAQGNPIWTFNLQAGQTQVLTLALRLPPASGTYQLDTAIDSMRNGITKHYGDYTLSLDIAAALDSASGWSGDIASLIVLQSERAARDHAVIYLNDALNLAQSGLYSAALVKLVAVIEDLRTIHSVNVTPNRLKLDQLLREVEYHIWCGAVSPKPAECGA